MYELWWDDGWLCIPNPIYIKVVNELLNSKYFTINFTHNINATKSYTKDIYNTYTSCIINSTKSLANN